MNKVLCTGELLIDFIGSDTTNNLSGQTSFLMKPGGAPANVACVIAALGGTCEFFGAVGNDGFGDFLEKTVKHYHVDTKNLKRSEKPTTLAFVSVDSVGERDFIFIRGADADVCLNELDPKTFEESAIFHFGAATGFLKGDLSNTYLELLEKAHLNHKCIVFDPNYRSAFWEKDVCTFIKDMAPFLEKAHLIKLSDEEALLITESSELSSAADILKSRYKGTFAVTLGAEGVWLFNRSWEVKIPAQKVDVKDTTGAGDAFIGGLIYELSLAPEPQKVIESRDEMSRFAMKANEIASKVCTEYGAMTALESLLNK